MLVVDDAEDIRVILSKLLQSRGHEVLTGVTGKDAVKILVEDRIVVDLILLDVMMPEMDGFEALSRVRERGINVPVIMLTAKSTDADIIKGYQVGADYYIAKPFRNETLLNIIDYLIGDLSDEERAKLETRI